MWLYLNPPDKALVLCVDELYATTGRPSIPPERPLKASLLIALYSAHSDRPFCEMLDYNILFGWFLDMNLGTDGDRVESKFGAVAVG
jgi:transposase